MLKNLVVTVPRNGVVVSADSSQSSSGQGNKPRRNMPEQIEHMAEKIFDNIKEVFAENSQKHKTVKFDEGGIPVSAEINKLLERRKSVHQIFGGGKCADVLLWRDKKFSSGVLVGATTVWLLFEWLNYHFLTLACFTLAIGMVIQFVWSNASSMLNRPHSLVPRLIFPEEVFVNIGASIGTEVNRFLGFLQDIASRRDLKKFILAIFGLWCAAVIGSWCNFLTVLYIGYVAVHTLPSFYEKYEDQVDGLVHSFLGQIQSQYQKLDEGVLSKIPKGNIGTKKSE